MNFSHCHYTKRGSFLCLLFTVLGVIYVGLIWKMINWLDARQNKYNRRYRMIQITWQTLNKFYFIVVDDKCACVLPAPYPLSIMSYPMNNLYSRSSTSHCWWFRCIRWCIRLCLFLSSHHSSVWHVCYIYYVCWKYIQYVPTTNYQKRQKFVVTVRICVCMPMPMP